MPSGGVHPINADPDADTLRRVFLRRVGLTSAESRRRNRRGQAPDGSVDP